MESISQINMPAVRIASNAQVPLPLMVCSHERSGTHFAMNAIAANSPYQNNPFVNFDTVPLGSIVNFHNARSVRSFFEGLKKHRCSSVVKSHFAADFFVAGAEFILNPLCKVVYIARNPVDVMLSYFRFIHFVPFHEGPKAKSVADFITAEPEGHMLRYQYRQAHSILDRWKSHVLGWEQAAARHPEILFVSYHDLDTNYSNEILRILRFIGVPCPAVPQRPDRVANTVHVPNPTPLSALELMAVKSIVARGLADQAGDGIIAQLMNSQA